MRDDRPIHDRLHAWVRYGVTQRLSDSYVNNPSREPMNPIRTWFDMFSQAEELESRDYPCEAAKGLLNRLLRESSELRTELLALATGIVHDIDGAESMRLAHNVRLRDYERTRRWAETLPYEQNWSAEEAAQMFQAQALPSVEDDLTEVYHQVGLIQDSLGEHQGAEIAPLTEANLRAEMLATRPPPSDDGSMPSLQSVSNTAPLSDDESDQYDTGDEGNEDQGSPTPRPTARFRAMTIQLNAVTDDRRAYRTAMHASGKVQDRPELKARCMMVYCTINGLKAKALLDSGSTINCVSPDFVQASHIEAFPLSRPVGLQLGCVGSRSSINFGVRAQIALDGDQRPVYLDVVNLDHYDVILGIPYMQATGMMLDFKSNIIRFGDHVMQSLKAIEQPVQRKTAPRQARTPLVPRHLN